MPIRFCSTMEAVNALELEKAEDKPRQIAQLRVYMDLVILDELGYLLLSQAREEPG